MRETRGIFVDVDKNGFHVAQLQPPQVPKAIMYSSYIRNGTGGWSTISFGGDLTLNLDRALKKIMKILTAAKLPPDPTSGLVLPMILLFSGHCTRIGIFGISTTMGPRYWEQHLKIYGRNQIKKKRKQLTSNHNTLVEIFLLKELARLSPPIKDVHIQFYD